MGNGHLPHRFLPIVVGAAFVMVAGRTAGQTEAELRGELEGKEVTLAMDMPGSSHGVDVYPGRKPAVKYDEYMKELKKYGVAIRKGATIIVTRIRVKDEHIEFQLGGGGAGSRGARWAPASKSTREQELEWKADRTPQETRELDSLRRRREAEDQRSKEETAKEDMDRRLGEGSRFNIRYERKPTAAELTPDSVRAALQEFVDFGGGQPSLITTGGEKQTRPLVVMIKGQLGDDETIGAGIIIGMRNDRLYIATADHVVRRGGKEIRELRVLFDWLPGEWTAAKLLDTADNALDLAVLSVESVKSPSDLVFGRLAARPPAVQQGVLFIGHGGNEPWHTRRAPDAISGVSGETIRFQSAFLVPGDSGGALVNDKWQIIGMLRSDQAGEANALSMQRILDKLREWNYPIALKAGGS